MTQIDDLDALTLAGVAHRCRQETERFFRRIEADARACFELFRRAVVEKDEAAWNLIVDQYRPLVAGWVERHPAYATIDEDADPFVIHAFEKFWQAMAPQKFLTFPDLKALLSYLKMCVHSGVMDYLRTHKRSSAEMELDERIITTASIASNARRANMEEAVVQRVQTGELWRQIGARLKDDQERLVVHCMFVEDLKPRQIMVEYGDIFSDVKEIYRIKENILTRLRRDQAIQRQLKTFLR